MSQWEDDAAEFVDQIVDREIWDRLNRCPECGAKMISRQNARDGSRFWGCSQFPRCRGTRDVEGRSRDQQQQDRWDAAARSGALDDDGVDR